MDQSVEQLKQHAIQKLSEAVIALYAHACECEVGPEREYAFNLYNIVRTAPKEAR